MYENRVRKPVKIALQWEGGHKKELQRDRFYQSALYAWKYNEAPLYN
jgi:hypothetical protein